MKINREGCTRIVLLTKRYAIKFPNFLGGYVSLLRGFLANHQEKEWTAAKLEGINPAVFSLPFGLAIVMRKARVLSPEEYVNFDYEKFIDRIDYVIPVENKWNSFGVLDGNVVAIDYGS